MYPSTQVPVCTHTTLARTATTVKKLHNGPPLHARPLPQGDGEEGDRPAKARADEAAEQGGGGATPERPSTPESSGVGDVPGRPRRGVAAVDNRGGGSSGKNKNRKREGSQERAALSMEVGVRACVRERQGVQTIICLSILWVGSAPSTGDGNLPAMLVINIARLGSVPPHFLPATALCLSLARSRCVSPRRVPYEVVKYSRHQSYVYIFGWFD